MGFSSTGSTGTGANSNQTSGQTSNQTGVGSNPTTTGQTQPTGSQYGGKGGGYAQPNPQDTPRNPYAVNTDTSSQQAYMPFGQTAYGYNMQRLAQRMDPSAALPGDYNRPSFYQPQAPQFFQPQIDVEGLKSAFGGKGGGTADTKGSTDTTTPATTPAATDTQQPQNQYDTRFSALEEKLNQLLAARSGAGTTAPATSDTTTPTGTSAATSGTTAPATSSTTASTGTSAATDSEIKDTGEATYSQTAAASKFGVGTNAAEPSKPLTDTQLSAAKEAKAAEATATAAKIDPVTGKPKYQYGTYTAPTDEQLSGLGSKANIQSYYNQQAARAKTDLAAAQNALKAAQKSGSMDDQVAAQKQVSAVLQRQAQIAADSKKTLAQVGKTGYQTASQIQASKDAAAKAAADKQAAAKAQTDAAAKAKADAAAKATADKQAAAKAKADAAAKA
ncbi:hypothetical protein EBZ39_10565, partial [bacterium]|nr:hypothetical protein [bacterium]